MMTAFYIAIVALAFGLLLLMGAGVLFFLCWVSSEDDTTEDVEVSDHNYAPHEKGTP